MWEELSVVGDNIVLNEEDDTITWSFNSNGQFSVQSLYAIINHRGVTPVYVQAVWKLNIPPRVHFFLWLLSNNRLLTRDNLAKKRDVSDPSCLFCKDCESISHLFFQCCVAKHVWAAFSIWLDRMMGEYFESITSLWIANKRYMICNIVSSTVMWVLWKLCNLLCFQGVPWSGMKRVFAMIGQMLRGWLPMFKMDVQEKVEMIIQLAETEAKSALLIKWRMDISESVQSSAQPSEVSGNATNMTSNRP